MKGLSVTKIVKEIKFEGVWGELKLKKGFQIQSFTKYLRNSSLHMKQRTTGKV